MTEIELSLKNYNNFFNCSMSVDSSILGSTDIEDLSLKESIFILVNRIEFKDVFLIHCDLILSSYSIQFHTILKADIIDGFTRRLFLIEPWEQKYIIKKWFENKTRIETNKNMI